MFVGYCVEEFLLVVLDINIVVVDDFYCIKLVYLDCIGEIVGIFYNLDYCWYYLLDMEFGEILLLKVFDL